MDTKTNERILKVLIENKGDYNFIDFAIPVVSQHISELSEGDINESLEYLKSKKLITYLIADATVCHLEVTIEGLAYFMEKEDLKSKEHIKKWDDRRWGVIMYVLGVASGMFLMWFKAKFLP